MMRHRPPELACLVFALLYLGSSDAGAFEAPRSFGYGVQQALTAATVGSFYSLLAVAYALVHGITNRIVLSFGDISMFGAFAAVYAVLFLLLSGSVTAVALALAFAVAAVCAGGLGLAAQRHVFAPLIRTPSQAIMIASIGLSIALQETMRLQTGGREQFLPPVYAGPLIARDVGGFEVRLSGIQAIVLALSLALLAGLALALSRTRLGRLWRACSQNLELARLCGIDTSRVVLATAAASGAFAAAAGWIIAVSYGGISFYMGLVFGLKALFASIIGGFGTIGGAVAGGFILAALETAWTATFPIVYRDAAVFLIIVLVLILKPDGLLGSERRRDSEV